MNNLMKFIYSTVVVAITWYINGIFTSFGIFNWYAAMEKPTITPPDAAFPIVWSILYVLMIVAFFMVLKKGDVTGQKKANQLFLGQLVLQVIWSYLFFHQGFIGLAFGVIILLDLVVYKLILNFKGVDKYATWLLYPYFWWLIYASFINFSFVYINGMIVQF